MKQESILLFIRKYFLLSTCILSGILCILYTARIFVEDSFVVSLIIASINLLYIPVALIFKEKCFPYFYLVYSVILVFLIAFEKTCLFNNFTALFIVCIVIMFDSKKAGIAIALYFAAVCIAFSINGESIFHFLIHMARSIWFLEIAFYVLSDRFNRKKLVLYEDEEKIIVQLCSGKVYQKEVEGFSENTVYRKLKAARERNGNISKDELIELYRKEHSLDSKKDE